ncbi:hypothetical protein ACLOJK_021957 [Asimina triloba]
MKISPSPFRAHKQRGRWSSGRPISAPLCSSSPLLVLSVAGIHLSSTRADPSLFLSCLLSLALYVSPNRSLSAFSFAYRLLLFGTHSLPLSSILFLSLSPNLSLDRSLFLPTCLSRSMLCDGYPAKRSHSQSVRYGEFSATLMLERVFPVS